MSKEERFGVRDLTYSGWHRTLSQGVTYIDLDACEYCRYCWEPLALFELAKDIGQREKAVMVMHSLAGKANVPAYLVFYRVAESGDIDQFRLRQIYPVRGEEQVMTPRAYGSWLESLRQQHRCHSGRIASLSQQKEETKCEKQTKE